MGINYASWVLSLWHFAIINIYKAKIVSPVHDLHYQPRILLQVRLQYVPNSRKYIVSHTRVSLI